MPEHTSEDALPYLDSLRELVAKVESTKRIVLVHPDHEAGALKVVEESPHPGLYEVRTNTECPVDRAFIIPTTTPYLRNGESP
jgi:hypothetical protein